MIVFILGIDHSNSGLVAKVGFVGQVPKKLNFIHNNLQRAELGIKPNLKRHITY